MSTSEHPPTTEELPPLDPTGLSIQPVKDLILIRSIDIKETEVLVGTIIIPSMSADQKRYEYGEVVAVGGGAYSTFTAQRIPQDVVIGDQVAHVEKAGWRFRHQGVEYRVVREIDVWCILNANRPDRLL